MKIAVVGTGAMGSIYAGLLADAGNTVWAIDIWQEHLAAIKTSGLRIQGHSGDRTITNIRTATKPADAEPCDLIIIATKASAVGAAATSIAPLLRKNSIILTIQNGLGAGDRIREYLSDDKILLGVAGGFGASLKGPGHVHHNGMELIRIGEMNGGVSERLEMVADTWRHAGFNVRAFEDINQLIWEKFICNVAYSAPCTIFDRTIGELMADRHSRWISKVCAREAYDVARASNINLSFDDPSAYITAFGSKMPNARPSMLLDHHANRASEIDAINGMVPVVAKKLGMSAPYNEVVSAIVRSREREFQEIDHSITSNPK